MRRITRGAGVLAAALTLSGAASALNAQAITSDRSGGITLQFTIAKYVEIVSDAPSTHNLTAYAPEGVTPGVSMIDTPDGMVTREIRANTPYRLSVLGLSESGHLEFRGRDQAGAGIRLALQCKLSESEVPAFGFGYSEWNCMDSGALPPTGSSWVTLRALTESPPAATHLAGVYEATVYLQIEAI